MRRFSWRSPIVIFALLLQHSHFSYGNAISEIDNLTVQTTSGPVLGTTVIGLSGKEVQAFLGIPYAQPPIKDLRFQRPKPIKPWNEVFEATKKPLPCYQFYSRVQLRLALWENTLVRRPWSENCLTLNIWSPNIKLQNEQNAPVLVFLHRGEFSIGSNIFPYMDGSTLSGQAEAVIISVNYRLGAFGFLTLGIPGAPGNVGLLDQQLALTWIKDNVNNFGGRSDATILVGSGDAGSASVGYHLISPGSRDLFTTPALFSGAPNCDWAFQDREESLRTARNILKSLSCEKDSTEESLNCLRNVHPEDVVDAQRDLQFVSHTAIFKPTVDGTFIAETPTEAMASGNFSLKYTLVWTESHEGSLQLFGLNPDVMAFPEKGFGVEGFRKVLKRLDHTLSDNEVGIIEDLYLEKCTQEDPLHTRDVAIRVYSDVRMDCCVNRFVEYVAKHGGQVTHTVDSLLKHSQPPWVGGAHGSSPDYVLGYPLAPEVYGYSKTQANMSLNFIIWINDHIRRSAREVDEDFSIYTLKDKPYVYWDAVGPNYLSKYRVEHCGIWEDIIPNLRKSKSDCST